MTGPSPFSPYARWTGLDQDAHRYFPVPQRNCTSEHNEAALLRSPGCVVASGSTSAQRPAWPELYTA